ncbi:GNAT family N-acetyltransferase [Palleronia sp. KMU-117]|uniref:GNAT family N-acetyltransferase n=1 Tax=Palleronia sp. KMU-117 TaxID=3434108 RepID=UPI003D73F91A
MSGPHPGTIEGRRLRFRPLTPDDAAYIQSLRTSPDYGRFLSPPAPSVAAQRAWIEAYKAREAAGQEYYFLIERRDDDAACGTMRIYDISPGDATWGSFILDANKPEKAALEALMMVHEIIFETLRLPRALFDVRKANSHALALYRRFGAVETGADDVNRYFRLDAADFARLAPSLSASLDG